MKRYKGCCWMCSPRWRGRGPAGWLPARDLRKLGFTRRLNRNGDYQ